MRMWGCRSGGQLYRIPYLKLDLLVVDVDHAGTEFNANCKVVNRLKPLVRELQQQA